MFNEGSEPQEVNPEEEVGEPTAEEIMKVAIELWPDYRDNIEDMLEGNEDPFEAIGNLLTTLDEHGVDQDEVFEKLAEKGVVI